MKVLLISCLVISSSLYAQTTIKVIDSGEAPVEDCLVKIEDILFETNGRGEFELREDYSTETKVYIGRIGFQTLITNVEDLRKNPLVTLDGGSIILPEVEVSPDPWLIFHDRVQAIVYDNHSEEEKYARIRQELEKLRPRNPDLK